MCERRTSKTGDYGIYSRSLGHDGRKPGGRVEALASANRCLSNLAGESACPTRMRSRVLGYPNQQAEDHNRN